MYEAQAAHLGDQPEGGFFVLGRNKQALDRSREYKLMEAKAK